MSIRNPRGIAAAAAISLAGASFPAFAHHAMDGATPQTFGQGFLSGLAHPVIGLEHLASLLVATLLTWAMTGTQRLWVPLTFVGATLGGTLLYLGAASIPMSETLVALSVVVAGVLALTRRHPGAFVLSAIFAASGILHGHACGEPVVGAQTTALLAYLAGFPAIQYALIIGGVLALERLARRSESLRAMTAPTGSAAATLTGGLFLAVSRT